MLVGEGVQQSMLVGEGVQQSILVGEGVQQVLKCNVIERGRNLTRCVRGL